MMNLGKKPATQEDLFEKLCAARALMDEGVADAFSVALAARRAGLSESHFSRCFKDVYGLSPYRYFLQAKIRRSMHLIASSQLPITDIAHQLGFTELSTFSRCFKKLQGVSPALYKRNLLGHGGCN